MNAESVWMSGPSLSQSFDANVEHFLETAECEPVTGAAANGSGQPVDMMDKPSGLPTSPQQQQDYVK